MCPCMCPCMFPCSKVSEMMIDLATPVTSEIGFYATPTFRLLGAEFGHYWQVL